MKPIARVLIAAGYSVHVVEGLGYNTSNVKQAAEIVEAYVIKNNLKNCVIVAHSKDRKIHIKQGDKQAAF
jgi:hypothetical protein